MVEHFFRFPLWVFDDGPPDEAILFRIGRSALTLPCYAFDVCDDRNVLMSFWTRITSVHRFGRSVHCYEYGVLRIPKECYRTVTGISLSKIQ